jgi:hypothetical protein
MGKREKAVVELGAVLPHAITTPKARYMALEMASNLSFPNSKSDNQSDC